MKKILVLLLLIIVSEPFFAQETTFRSSREIFLKSQMSSAGVRLPSTYSVIGIKEPNWQYAVLEFISSDCHLVTIEQNGSCLYSQYIILPQNNEIKRINIPLNSLDKGIYTMTVKNLNSGEISLGNFSVQ